MGGSEGAARTGDGFHRAREFRLEAVLLHHGNGDLTGRGHVGRRRTGKRTEQHGRKHGRLGGTAAVLAHAGKREIAEEVIRTADAEYGAEQDEAGHNARYRAENASPHAFAAQVHPCHGTGIAVAGTHHEIGEVVTVDKIEEGSDDESDRNPACHTARCFEYGKTEGKAEAHLRHGGVLPFIHQRGRVDRNVAGSYGRHQHQKNVDDGKRSQLLAFLPRRNEQSQTGYGAGAYGPVRDGKDDDSEIKEHVEQRQDDIDRPYHAYGPCKLEAKIAFAPGNGCGVFFPSPSRIDVFFCHDLLLLNVKESIVPSSCKIEKK